MKRTNILLISFILALLGCEDTKTKEPHVTVENTTEVFTPKDTTQHHQNHTKIEESFNLNLQQKTITIKMKNRQISTDSTTTPLLLLSLFNTQSNQHASQLPYLPELQKRYKNNLTVLTILVDQQEKEEVEKKYPDLSKIYTFFTDKKESERFVNTVMKIVDTKEKLTLPLSILYKNGNYHIHYEGATPIEMIEHDITEAIH